MKLLSCLAVFIVFVTYSYAQPGLGFTYTHQEFEEEEDYFTNEYTIQFVFKKSPAEKAGLKAGDKIIKFHDATLIFVNTIAMANIIKDSPPTVELIISRNNIKQNFTITKADRSTYLNICLEGNCNNGTGTFVDKDGVTYTGTFKNKLKEGSGKSVASNGDTYEGQWKNDKREGKGTYTSKLDPNRIVTSGWNYKGDWKEDQMTGKGKLTYNGGSYEGEMLQNVKSGKGKLVAADKTIYEGEWKNDKLNGNATVTMPNGDISTGFYIDGKPDGEVTTYTKANGVTTKVIYKLGRKQ